MIPAARHRVQEAYYSGLLQFQHHPERAVSDSDASPEHRRVNMRPQPASAPRRSARVVLLLATSTMTLLLLLLCVLPSGCLAAISDTRFCYDEACSVPVSEGRTTLRYNSNSKFLLSFDPNTSVTVYSKETGGNKNEIWGVEIKGQRGYAPALFIREYAVHKKRSELKHPEPIAETLSSDAQNDSQQSETTTQSSDPLVSSSMPTDQVQNKVQEDAVSKEAPEETFDPHQVSPSYDVYDGTVIPLEPDDEQPTLESYSTKILADEELLAAKLGSNEEPSIFNFSINDTAGEQAVVPPEGETVILAPPEESNEVLLNESVEIQGSKDVESSYSSEVPIEDVGSKEEVQLDMYPSLLSSTLSALSGILSNGEESSEDSIENDPSEKSNEESTEETPVTVEPEVSNPEIEIGEETGKVDIEDVFKQVQEELAGEAENKTIDEVVQSDSKQVSENEKVPDDLDIKIDEIINEINELTKLEDVSSEKNEGQQDSDVVDINHQDESVDEWTESSDPASAISEEIPVLNLEESLLTPPENVEGIEDVPKQEEAETVIPVPEGFPVDLSTETDQNPIQASELNESPFHIVLEENPAPPAVPLEEQSYVESTTPFTEPVSPNTVLEEDSAPPAVPLEEQSYVESTTVFTEPPVSPETQDSQSPEVIQIPETEGDLQASSLEVTSEETTKAADPVELEGDTKVDGDTIDSNNNLINSDTPDNTSQPSQNDSAVEHVEPSLDAEKDSVSEQVLDVPETLSIGEFLNNRNLLNAEEDKADSEESILDKIVEASTNGVDVNQIQLDSIQAESLLGSEKPADEDVHMTPTHEIVEKVEINEAKDTNSEANADNWSTVHDIEATVADVPLDTCDKTSHCSNEFAGHQYRADANAVTNERRMEENSETLLVVCITAVTTLLFSLGYYFIESKRRDAYLIGKINTLEKDLMITKKECTMLDENFKSTKSKLDSIEDESFGSNEMVLSLKAELVAAENTKVELEDQIATLEKELETTAEAGLNLERMLRELLSSHGEENNPLAKSIEDLQIRLNEQQTANESLTSALAAKTQENETLTGDLSASLEKVEQLEVEITKLAEEVKTQLNVKHNLEQTLTSKIHKFEIQVKSLSEDKAHIRKQLKMKELEVKELSEVVEKFNSDSLDFEKLYEVSHIKAEAVHLVEECNELKMKLSEEEGARQLLEEHMKVINQEIASLSEQCKVAEKEKKDAETRLEVLTKFFEEKESQRQKEEAVWLEKQGEASTTVERLHTMQAEILNYKQQIETLKREIFDQEREYKNQISALENKAHEHWLTARQNERRLEEVKAECSQLRNRLTLVEKSINDVDSDAKLNRLQGANGETGAHSSLYPGGETSTSPLLFSPGGGGGSGGVPPPPSYLFGMPPPPPPPTLGYLPPPPELVGSRPPPLGGGRLSSPPPQSSSSAMQSGANNASSSAASPPPLMPPFPMPPFHGDHLPPLPPLHILKHLPPPAAGGPLPPLHFPSQHPGHHLHHNHHGAPWPPDDPEGGPPSSFARTGAQQQPQQRHNRNHKGSLHSSGESLDKSHHSGKV